MERVVGGMRIRERERDKKRERQRETGHPATQNTYYTKAMTAVFIRTDTMSISPFIVLMSRPNVAQRVMNGNQNCLAWKTTQINASSNEW